MQGNIVENRQDIVLLEGRKDFLTVYSRIQQDIIHMGIVLTPLGNDRASQVPLRLEGLEQRMVAVPTGKPLPCNPICFFELRPEKGCDKFPG